MSISEQVEALRDVAGAYKHNGLSMILEEATNTIEALSAKLEDMERSEDYGGWIYCGDGENLPDEPFGCLVTVIDSRFNGSEFEDFENILPYHVGYDGRQWNDLDGERIPFEVIAWMPVPKEPYHEP